MFVNYRKLGEILPDNGTQVFKIEKLNLKNTNFYINNLSQDGMEEIQVVVCQCEF